jgi:hypothetical protein
MAVTFHREEAQRAQVPPNHADVLKGVHFNMGG